MDYKVAATSELLNTSKTNIDTRLVYSIRYASKGHSMREISLLLHNTSTCQLNFASVDFPGLMTITLQTIRDLVPADVSAEALRMHPSEASDRMLGRDI